MRLDLLPLSFLTLLFIGADIQVAILIALCRGNYRAAMFYSKTRWRKHDLMGPPTDGGILYSRRNGTVPASVATSPRMCGPRTSFFASLGGWGPQSAVWRLRCLKPQKTLHWGSQQKKKVRAFAMGRRKISKKQAVLDLASTEYAGMDFKRVMWHVQAFDARNFIVRDRGWRWSGFGVKATQPMQGRRMYNTRFWRGCGMKIHCRHRVNRKLGNVCRVSWSVNKSHFVV